MLFFVRSGCCIATTCFPEFVQPNARLDVGKLERMILERTMIIARTISERTMTIISIFKSVFAKLVSQDNVFDFVNSVQTRRPQRNCAHDCTIETCLEASDVPKKL